jgi:cytochrome c biogenesis protein CcdA
MMDTGLMILAVGFGLGLLHALDADHIIAVSGLASTQAKRRESLMFCLRWALGHGLSLIAIGGAVLLLGMAIPEALSQTAEHLVGIVLILIGAWVLWDLYKRRIHLHFHRHDDLPPHAHLHSHAKHDAHDEAAHRHTHSAVAVGLLHGTAGSAPLLALLPLAQTGSPWLGLGYIVLFSIGVLVAMIVFGGLLGLLFEYLQRRGDLLLRVLRTLVGLGSIGFGVYLFTH